MNWLRLARRGFAAHDAVLSSASSVLRDYKVFFALSAPPPESEYFQAWTAAPLLPNVHRLFGAELQKQPSTRADVVCSCLFIASILNCAAHAQCVRSNEYDRRIILHPAFFFPSSQAPSNFRPLQFSVPCDALAAVHSMIRVLASPEADALMASAVQTSPWLVVRTAAAASIFASPVAGMRLLGVADLQQTPRATVPKVRAGAPSRTSTILCDGDYSVPMNIFGSVYRHWLPRLPSLSNVELAALLVTTARGLAAVAPAATAHLHRSACRLPSFVAVALAVRLCCASHARTNLATALVRVRDLFNLSQSESCSDPHPIYGTMQLVFKEAMELVRESLLHATPTATPNAASPSPAAAASSSSPSSSASSSASSSPSSSASEQPSSTTRVDERVQVLKEMLPIDFTSTSSVAAATLTDQRDLARSAVLETFSELLAVARVLTLGDVSLHAPVSVQIDSNSPTAGLPLSSQGSRATRRPVGESPTHGSAPSAPSAGDAGASAAGGASAVAPSKPPPRNSPSPPSPPLPARPSTVAAPAAPLSSSPPSSPPASPSSASSSPSPSPSPSLPPPLSDALLTDTRSLSRSVVGFYAAMALSASSGVCDGEFPHPASSWVVRRLRTEAFNAAHAAVMQAPQLLRDAVERYVMSQSLAAVSIAFATVDYVRPRLPADTPAAEAPTGDVLQDSFGTRVEVIGRVHSVSPTVAGDVTAAGGRRGASGASLMPQLASSSFSPASFGDLSDTVPGADADVSSSSVSYDLELDAAGKPLPVEGAQFVLQIVQVQRQVDGGRLWLRGLLMPILVSDPKVALYVLTALKVGHLVEVQCTLTSHNQLIVRGNGRVQVVDVPREGSIMSSIAAQRQRAMGTAV